MKKTRVLIMSAIIVGALAFSSCGNKEKKETGQEGEKKECCEKKDSTASDKKCCDEASDSTKVN